MPSPPVWFGWACPGLLMNRVNKGLGAGLATSYAEREGFEHAEDARRFWNSTKVLLDTSPLRPRNAVVPPTFS